MDKKIKYIILVDKETNGTKGMYLYSPKTMNEKQYKMWLKDNPNVKIYKTIKLYD